MWSLTCLVCILPKRDRNWFLDDRKIFFFWVCILPMRDWNSYPLSILNATSFSLYLTYEGLKHFSNLSFFDLPFVVCILPMRDWNELGNSDKDHLLSCLYLTYEGLKREYLRKRNIEIRFVCILPMRDWNFKNGDTVDLPA